MIIILLLPLDYKMTKSIIRTADSPRKNLNVRFSEQMETDEPIVNKDDDDVEMGVPDDDKSDVVIDDVASN